MLVCTCKCVRNHSSGRACVWLFIVVWRDAAGVAAQKKETDKKLREEREQKKNEAFCELRGAQPALTPPRLLLVEAFHETLFTFSSIQRVNLHRLECLQWHWNCCLTVMNEKGAATLLYVLQCRHPSIKFLFFYLPDFFPVLLYCILWHILQLQHILECPALSQGHVFQDRHHILPMHLRCKDSTMAGISHWPKRRMWLMQTSRFNGSIVNIGQCAWHHGDVTPDVLAETWCSAADRGDTELEEQISARYVTVAAGFITFLCALFSRWPFKLPTFQVALSAFVCPWLASSWHSSCVGKGPTSSKTSCWTEPI